MNVTDSLINQFFKSPIHFHPSSKTLNPTIVKDLEMVETVDSSCTPMCPLVFNQNTHLAKVLNPRLAEQYTADVDFLKDTQQLLRSYKSSTGVCYTDYSPDYQKITELWNEIQGRSLENFKEKYYFVEQEWLEFLNHSEGFLQFTSIYNLLSPIISLIVPILILILPFFILKLNGIHITVSKYIDTLKEVASQNAIGKLFVVNFADISAQEKVSIGVSAMLYLYSIYQNYMVCARFNQNMKQIHGYFNELRIYLQHTLERINDVSLCIQRHKLNGYFNFDTHMQNHREVLQRIQMVIKPITEYNMFNLSKIKEIGYVFKCFYLLRTDVNYYTSLNWSLGFNGYVDCLKGLQQNLAEGKMNFAELSKGSTDKQALSSDKNTKSVIRGSYYAPLKDGDPVKNTVVLKKNHVVTGPNASGKTTILKSTLLNLILTQQFGCGFYDSATLVPFDHFHCYLNIPDTSGRDSLFQAEARRCKEMLDIIEAHGQERHFCVFDELYSGTNPEEAEQSATSFMKFLSKKPNVTCMLTTHFSKVCKRLAKQPSIQNYKMVSRRQGDHGLIHTYHMTKGISDIKGGAVVLKQLNYPQEILDDHVAPCDNRKE